MRIVVQSEPFDAGAELTAFMASAVGAGAVVSFSGLVRDVAGGLDHMEIEHYPGMTERALRQMAEAARDRFGLTDVLVIHRHGRLAANAPIMMVATAAPHRGDAFAAAEFLMDYLKSRAPFWKKEVTSEGAGWVDAKATDEDALARW
jgi:Molybdopterin converting factor, large subunit